MDRTILIPNEDGYIRDEHFFMESFYRAGHLVETGDRFERRYSTSKEDLIRNLDALLTDCKTTINGSTVVMVCEEGAITFHYRAERFFTTDDVYYLCDLAITLEHEVFLKAVGVFSSLETWDAPSPEPDGSFTVSDYFTDLLGRIRSRSHHIKTSSMNEIRSDLYPGIDVDKLVSGFLHSKENILIMVGKPGTGKTTFMKKVLQQLSLEKGSPKSFYTKDMRVLKEPSFWAETIHQYKPDFLVLDDLDKELTPRTQSDSNAIVNQLLSLSNGLFENDMKVIITTNLVDEGIDSAMLRAGRCFDVLNLPFLTLEYAKDLWLNTDTRTDLEWDALFSPNLEHVTQALYMSNLQSLTEGNSRDYLTNKSISVREKYTIGL